jgi:hypothetical protein
VLNPVLHFVPGWALSGRDRIAGELRRRSDLRYVYTSTRFANGRVELVFALTNGLKGCVCISSGVPRPFDVTLLPDRGRMARSQHRSVAEVVDLLRAV